MLCLTNIGFVQCYSLGSRIVCCMVVFILLYSVFFCFACFASQTSCLCNVLPSIPVVCCTLFLSVIYFCFVLFASPTSGLCSAFPFGSSQVYTLLCFFVLFSLLFLYVLCLTSSGFCSDFSPAPLEFASFIFCFVLFSFNFVFCVLSLAKFIFLRFP